MMVVDSDRYLVMSVLELLSATTLRQLEVLDEIKAGFTSHLVTSEVIRVRLLWFLSTITKRHLLKYRPGVIGLASFPRRLSLLWRLLLLPRPTGPWSRP